MPDFHLTTSFNAVLVALAAIGAGALAFAAYRFTVPPISRTLKSLLTVLRALGLFLLFLLVGEPLLSLVYHRFEKPVLALLIDQSRSMTIQDKMGDRKTILFKTLDGRELQALKSNNDVLVGAFDTKLHLFQSFVKDSLSLAGEGTDIGGALKQLKAQTTDKNVQSVLLITDGNATTGTSPLYEAEELGLPVFAVGIGDTSEPRDVLVRRALANTITYVGNKVPVNVTVKSSGFTNERVEVTLLEGGKTLDRKTLRLESGTREYEVPLSFVPEVEGTKKIYVEVSELPDEISHQNNRSSFYVKVLKSKMEIVLMAGAPSPDVAAVVRALKDDGNVNVKTFIERGNGQFYEGLLTDQILHDAECLVLVGYPAATSALSGLAAVSNAVTAGKGVFFLLSRSTDFQKLRMLQPALPFTVPAQSGEEIQVFFAVSEVQQTNPILRISSSFDVFSKLPPAFALDVAFGAKPEAEVLGSARILSTTTNDPLFLSRHVNRSKSLALLCYGLWRWKSYSDGVPGSEHLLENLFSNSIRWLVTRDDEKPVQVRPTKEIFAGSDPVEFTAQVYDENYRPIEDGEVSLSVSRKGQTSQLTLTSLGNGRFEGAYDPLPEGDYTYAAKAVVGGRQLAEERGSFSVGGLNAEFQEMRANKLLLQQIAARTGGTYYDAAEIRRLPGDLAALPNFRPRDVTVAQQFELWNRSWILSLAVALFALEWFLRKRNGMI